MYAKLNFNTGTSTAEAIRDIVRLISDSNSGSANLSSLEFVNTSTSELFAGVNSGWSVNSAGGTLPSTGTAVSSSDSNYILTGTCETGSKAKYCGIHANGNWTNSTVYSGTTFALTVANVLDPGTATEMWSNGYTGTSAGIGDCHGVMPVSVHVWADPRRIILHGQDGNGAKIFITHMESAETPSTTAFNLPPVAVFLNVQAVTNVSLTEDNSVSYRGDTQAVWHTESSSIDFISFTGSMYMHARGLEGVIRSTGWHRIGGFSSNPGSSSGANQAWATRKDSRADDGTQYGALFLPRIPYQDDVNYSIDFLVSTTPIFWGPQNCHSYWDASTDYDKTFGRSDAQAFDSSGNSGIPKYPLVWFNAVCFNTETYDFASKSGIFRAPAGLGATGDTVTIGSDVFQYISMGSGTMEALLVKRT